MLYIFLLGMTKRDVFKKMEEEQGIRAVPEKSFYRLWKKFCQNVKTTKVNNSIYVL